MADAKILNEVPISMKELKDELVKIKKRDKELNFRANKTEEYLNQFTTLKKEKELEEELTKLDIPRIKDQHIKKIVDVLPCSVEELKTLIQGYPISVNAENLKKIVDVVKKYTQDK